MKHSVFVLSLVLLYFSSCKPTDKGFQKVDFTKGDAMFSIEIDEPNNPYIKLRSYGKFKHLDLEDIGPTMDTIKGITEGYFTFSDRMHASGFFIGPGKKVSIKNNTRDFVRSIEFEGDYVKENYYLKDFFLLSRDFGRILSVQHLAYLDENHFRNTIDSIKGLRLALLDKHEREHDLDDHFVYLEKNRLYYEWASRMENYEAYRKYALEDETYHVSEDFYNYKNKIEYNNRNLIIAPSYHYYLESHYQRKANALTEKDSSDVYLNYLKVVGLEAKDSVIKERLLYSYAIQNLRESKAKEDFLEVFNTYSTSKEHKEEVKARFNEMERLLPGKPAPQFELEDQNGDMVKLTDLKGSYVYIDIWATWCKPCVAEMPYFEKIKVKYKNSGIKFVSISTNSYKKDWSNFLELNKPKGIQLYAGDDETFKTLFRADQVPQALLINPDGNISTALAPRPSETELIEMIFDRIQDNNNKIKPEDH